METITHEYACEYLANIHIKPGMRAEKLSVTLQDKVNAYYDKLYDLRKKFKEVLFDKLPCDHYLRTGEHEILSLYKEAGKIIMMQEYLRLQLQAEDRYLRKVKKYLFRLQCQCGILVLCSQYQQYFSVLRNSTEEPPLVYDGIFENVKMTIIRMSKAGIFSKNKLKKIASLLWAIKTPMTGA